MADDGAFTQEDIKLGRKLAAIGSDKFFFRLISQLLLQTPRRETEQLLYSRNGFHQREILLNYSS
jgi:hypothetical protein